MPTRRSTPPAGAPIGTIWFGGPVDASSATLRIRGADLDPDEITKLMGCEPSQSAHAGQILVGRNGKSRTVREGFWHLSAERKPLDISDQIESLLGKLTDDLAVWHTITQRFRVDLFCGLFLETTNRGLEISPGLLRSLADRNIALGMDIYAP